MTVLATTLLLLPICIFTTMTITNAQLFCNALESVTLSESAHIAMIYWRDTPATVKVSVIDIDGVVDIIQEFKSKFEEQLALVTELNHVSVIVATQDDITAIGNGDFSSVGGAIKQVCMYLHGTVAMDINNDVL